MDDNGNSSIGSTAKVLKRTRMIRAIVALFSGSGFLIIIFPILVIIIIIASFIFNEDAKNGNSEICYTIKSVSETCKSITVKGSGTVSVDEYVGGVVSHEFGGAANYPEMLKAQAIAARSYVLASISPDSDGNCVVNDTSQAFQTYDANVQDVYLQAAKDTSGMVMVDDSGNIARTEYSANSLPNPYSSYTGDTVTMSERNLEIPKSWFSVHKTAGDSELNRKDGQTDAYGRDVYGNGHGRGMGQIAALYLVMEQGYTYDQVLDYFYGQDSVYKWTLAPTNGNSSQICTGGNLQTLDHYTLYHEGLDVLDHTLSASEIQRLNASLEVEIKKAGHGSGAAVAAVGQGLVYWLEKNKHAYLSYYWAGGHGGFDGDDTVIGADDDWGSTRFGVDTHNRNYRPYYGMDCSGFVSWATRMACDKDFGAHPSWDWNDRGKALSSISEVEPGDVLSNNDHIMLVVYNGPDDGPDDVIFAEETGKGLMFSKHSDVSSYNIRSMKSWYEKNCTDIQPGTGGGSSFGNMVGTDDLSKQISEYIQSKATSGSWSVYVKNLKTNKVSSYNSNKRMTSASVIKLFIAGAVYDQVNKGVIDESSISDDLGVMIDRSDNNAANTLIDKIYMSTINSYISSKGYRSTKLNRKLLSDGEENYVSASDVGMFLERLYNGQIVNAKYSSLLLGHMKNQQIRYKIPNNLGCSNCSASKSGELPDKGVANDSAIVYSPSGDYIVVILSETGTSVTYDKANSDVGAISRLIYDYFN